MADENADTTETPLTDDNGQVTWTASEFIAHEKSAGWYFKLIAAAILLAALMYMFTRDAVSVAVVIIGAAFLGVFAARPPRQLDYGINHNGVKVGAKQYGFQDFKSFSVVQEGSFGAINFMPLKRFAPVLTIYYAPQHEEQILAVLTEYLPFEEATPDRIESLMRRIRF